MPVYQVIMYMDVRCRGFSEVHHRSLSEPNLEAVWNSCLTLAVKRAALLGRQGKLYAMRVSSIDENGDSYLGYTNLPGSSDYDCASPELTVYTLLKSQNNNSRKAVYLRGFPDDLELEGGVFQPGYETWVSRANEWATELKTPANNWGWMSRRVAQGGGDVQGKRALIGYGPAGPGSRKIEISFAGNLFSLKQVEDGEPLEVYFSNVNGRGGSRLNGSQIVIPRTQSSCVTWADMALLPFTGGGTGRRFAYEFVGYRQSQFQKIGRRSPGKVFTATPGRSSTTPKG